MAQMLCANLQRRDDIEFSLAQPQPLDHQWMCEKPVHVVLWRPFKLDAIGLKACCDRCKHDVGAAEIAEHPRRAAASVVADRNDPLDVSFHFGCLAGASSACSGIDRHC